LAPRFSFPRSRRFFFAVTLHPAQQHQRGSAMPGRDFRRRVPVWLSVFALLAGGVAEGRDKTDILILKNGDRITGEIVKLEYGKLQFKTDDMGTLSVEWPAVAKLESQYTFDVETVTGQRYLGVISASDDVQRLVVVDEQHTTELDALTVSRIAQVEETFLKRVNGSLSFGYNFTKSSDITTLSTHFDASYRAETIAMGLGIDITSTTSPEEGTLDRDQITFNYQWLRPRRNFWAGLASIERNEELGIEGRLQGGGAYGHYFRQTSFSELAGLIGVVGNQEWVTGEEGGQQSIEGLLGGVWRIFRFADPETSLTSSAALYPSITESNRYRGAFDLTLRQEIISDFYIDLSLYYDYDSQPPGEDPVKDDYGIVTSLGYTF
jgi:hypothetical protein